jgi:hypothetical protein
MIFKSVDEFYYRKDADKITRKIKEMNVCLQKFWFETELDRMINISLENNKLSFGLLVSVDIPATIEMPGQKKKRPKTFMQSFNESEGLLYTP